MNPKGTFSLKEKPVILGKGGPTEAGWHMVQSFLRCPKAYQYGQVRGLRQPLVETPSAFAKGILHHAMRARWFALRFKHDTKAMNLIQQAAEEAAEESQLPFNPKDMLESRVLFDAYMEHWLKRPLPKPVAAEYKIGPAPLHEKDWDSKLSALFRTARLDDVSHYPEAGGALCVGESKTTSDDISGTIREYELHGQPLMQLVLWEICPQGRATHGPVAGVLLDVTKKAYSGRKPDFARVFIEVRDHTLAWYVQSMRHFLKQAARVEWDSEVPRNVSGCTYMAGRARVDCAFKELCRFGRSAAGNYVLANGTLARKFAPEPGKEKMPWE